MDNDGQLLYMQKELKKFATRITNTKYKYKKIRNI